MIHKKVYLLFLSFYRVVLSKKIYTYVIKVFDDRHTD
jgi:hypothetical protein